MIMITVLILMNIIIANIYCALFKSTQHCAKGLNGCEGKSCIFVPKS